LSISKDQLFRQILNTAEAVPACLGFYIRPSKTKSDAGVPRPKASRLLLDSTTLLFSLQPGVNGFQGWTHGGLLAALMDEAMGSCFYINYRLQAEAKLQRALPVDMMDLTAVNTVTSRMDIKLKKPLPTPAVVLVKTTLVEISGRKILVETTIEGETGVQYAACDATWIALPRERL
jgi:acyl-coenzyme A thioesterase PaaI-like protein